MWHSAATSCADVEDAVCSSTDAIFSRADSMSPRNASTSAATPWTNTLSDVRASPIVPSRRITSSKSPITRAVPAALPAMLARGIVSPYCSDIAMPSQAISNPRCGSSMIRYELRLNLARLRACRSSSSIGHVHGADQQGDASRKRPSRLSAHDLVISSCTVGGLMRSRSAASSACDAAARPCSPSPRKQVPARKLARQSEIGRGLGVGRQGRERFAEHLHAPHRCATPRAARRPVHRSTPLSSACCRAARSTRLPRAGALLTRQLAARVHADRADAMRRSLRSASSNVTAIACS